MPALERYCERRMPTRAVIQEPGAAATVHSPMTRSDVFDERQTLFERVRS
jgi:hypothetical protein